MAIPPPTWFSTLFGFNEETRSAAAWEATRSRFTYDTKTGVLTTPSSGENFAAGLFSTPTLGELRVKGRALLSSRPGTTTVTFTHATTNDVLEMHSQAQPGSIFLAASGLNCLEFPGRGGSPTMGVTCYAHDWTQGPACALACAAGTVVRNYFGENSPTHQIDCLATLADAIGGGYAARTPWIVSAGYVKGCNPDGPASKAALDEANSANFLTGSSRCSALRDLVRVGIQADTGIIFTSRWTRAECCGLDAPRVTQVYAAALSLGGYKTPRDVPDESWAPLATLVLEAAYEATLWAAVASSSARGLRRTTVYLCGLGLGVFGNERSWVANAIGRAVAILRKEGAELDVVFLHFREINADLRREIDDAIAAPRDV